MLSPNDGSRIVLLPEDKELIRLAGWSEEQYRDFVRYSRGRSRIKPGTPVAAFLGFTGPAAAAAGINPFVAIGLLVVGVALSVAASYLLRPKLKTGKRGTARLDSNTVNGQNIVSGARYAPKAGFDSVQNVVEIGSIIPLVYARREVIDGVAYGGVRINTNLLWSQVQSFGGDQLLRAIYLVGEGDDRANSMELDAQQFAFGNNLLGNYDLAVSNTSRLSIYYSNDGGRLVNADHIAGRTPATDPGNSQTGDVFAVRGAGGVFGPNFSYANKPSTQTSFGLYGWIGNGVMMRSNPTLRSAYSANLRPNGQVACAANGQEILKREKDQFNYPGQSGITAGNTNLAINDVVTYQLNPAESRTALYTWNAPAGAVGSTTTTLGSNDINTAIAARQTTFDENIVIGELYKIGSALAVCETRTDGRFEPVVDGGNSGVTATFRVVRAGVMSPPPGTGGTQNVTITSQIFRVSRGSFVTEYPCQVLEMGLRSSVGIQVNGLTNTIEGGFTYSNMDGQACLGHQGNFVGDDQELVTQQYNAATVNVPEERYSFFRLMFRPAGTDAAFTELDSLYGVRSETNQVVYNYIRLEMPDTRRWEFRIEPVSGWELRSGNATGTRRVLDPRVTTEVNTTENGVTVRYRGENAPGDFSMRWFSPVENTLEWDGQSMGDAWARVAEAFIFNEVTTSVGNNPEHEIVYINTILPNPVAPNYEDLAIIGMNIRASREFSNLSQFSVYMNRGLGGFHDFPSVLRDLLTNDRFGVGAIASPQQIDEQSFQDSTTWSTGRRYYFDGTLTDPINIRQWGASTAKDFLLDLIIRNGRFALQPLLNFTGPEDITGLFTAGNILEDSFELVYFDQEQRQQPLVSIKWRQEQTTGDLNNRGLFPIVRELTVRESSAPADAPQEEIDLSDFCTSQIQAIDRAKYECRFRRLSTHQVRFTTTADQAALDLGRCFRLSLETLSFDQPTNGYVARDGTITSWPALADGNHLVVTWDGTNYVEQTITVSNGRTGDISETVFSVADNVFQTQTYRVQSLSFNEEGNIEVEAVHWPTDEEGVSLLTAGWDVDANWEIEGEI